MPGRGRPRDPGSPFPCPRPAAPPAGKDVPLDGPTSFPAFLPSWDRAQPRLSSLVGRWGRCSGSEDSRAPSVVGGRRGLRVKARCSLSASEEPPSLVSSRDKDGCLLLALCKMNIYWSF